LLKLFHITLLRASMTSGPANPRSVTRRRILSVGDDQNLLGTRELVLESGGYFVVSRSSFRIMQDDEFRFFDLIVLCHSIEAQQSERVIDHLRKCAPGKPILQLLRNGQDPASNNDPSLIAGLGPVKFLEKVSSLLERSSPAPVSRFTGKLHALPRTKLESSGPSPPKTVRHVA
jgi:hypothetical protein